VTDRSAGNGRVCIPAFANVSVHASAVPLE